MLKRKVYVMKHLVPILALCVAASATFADDSWKLPLDEKEAILEQNNVERHNILGLYPSQVDVPLDGSPVDNSTLGSCNIAHAVCWSANYLAGASYRYAFLKRAGAPEEVLAKAPMNFEGIYRCQLGRGARSRRAMPGDGEPERGIEP